MSVGKDENIVLRGGHLQSDLSFFAVRKESGGFVGENFREVDGCQFHMAAGDIRTFEFEEF